MVFRDVASQQLYAADICDCRVTCPDTIYIYIIVHIEVETQSFWTGFFALVCSYGPIGPSCMLKVHVYGKQKICIFFFSMPMVKIRKMGRVPGNKKKTKTRAYTPSKVRDR